MINLIAGRSGYGKSSKLLEMLKETLQFTDRNTVVIVPHQQSYTWEERIASMFPPAFNLRCEITTIPKLYDTISREFGGLRNRVIDDGGRILLVWRAMMSVREQLRVFRGGYDDKNLPVLLKAIDELKKGGVTPAKAEKALEKLEQDGTATGLRDRLHDAVLVYGVYEKILHEEFVDRTDLLTTLSDLIAENDYFRGKDVFVDSFSPLLGIEEKILSGIMKQAENVSVTFTCPRQAEGADFEIQFYEYKRFLRVCRSLATRLGKEIRIIELNEDRRHRSDELRNIESYIFDYSFKADPEAAKRESVSGSVRIVECTDRYDEAEACAAVIEKLLRNGYRNRDIAVVAENIYSREGVIDTVLRRHGISCYISEPRVISATPAVRLVLAALKITYSGWQREDVVKLIKTGMIDTAPGAAERFEPEYFETYTNTWNIHGKKAYCGGNWTMNPRGYQEQFTDEDKKTLTLVNSMKNRVIPPIQRFSAVFDGHGTAPVKEIAAAVVELAEGYNVRKALDRTAAAYSSIDMEAEAERTVAGWNAVCEILDKMADFLGDTTLDAARFAGLFAKVASTMDRGTIPTGLDEVILCSAPSMGFDSARCVIVLGSVAGEFPGTGTDGKFFSDRDREIMEKAGMTLDIPDDRRQISRSYFDYYRAVTAAEEKLYIMVPGGFEKASDGAVRINDILKSLGIASKTKFSALPLKEVVYSLAGAEYQLSRRPEGPETEILRRLIKDRGRGAGFDISLTAGEERVPPCTDGKLSLSNTRINSFTECPFQHSCQYTLDLRAPADSKIENNDIGTFVHAVLERFFESTSGNGNDPTELTDGEVDAISGKIIEEYVENFAGNSGVSRDNGRLDYLFERLTRYVPLFVKGAIRELRSVPFKPSAYELKIGGKESDVMPVRYDLDDGSAAELVGKIDRVDEFESATGEKYLRIIDYKTGNADFKLEEVLKGHNIQLLAYLFTLWKRKWNSGPQGVAPGGAYYLSVSPKTESQPKMISGEEAEQIVLGKVKANGIRLSSDEIPSSEEKSVMTVSMEEMADLSRNIDEVVMRIGNGIKEGIADADPVRFRKDLPCKYCKYAYVCKASREVGNL
ncbi:MAG: exodeoxyribonuclease V subunit gamma [Clostridia bacterium]|nr:exodeoxyribonuclease V subunit gamma [Clostridia bacterium]